MTIFLEVLVQLIRDQLSHVSSSLTYQSIAYGHNHKLSLDQKEIVSKLEADMIRFISTNNDKTDAESIVAIVTAARVKIQEARESHGVPRDEGKTMECLNKLILHTPGFYSKLEAFQFNLLNKMNTRTPENIIYYHACYYFGEEIFVPKAHIDVGIRGKKEEALRKRLQSLSELIKPEYTLEEQRTRALDVLRDLDADNVAVIKGAGSSGLTLPTVTLFGLFQVSSPNEWFAGKGRLNEHFKLAKRQIDALTNDTFQPPVVVIKPKASPSPVAALLRVVVPKDSEEYEAASAGASPH